MNTYEQGRAPEGAPYTYDRDHLGFVGVVYRSDGSKDEDLSREIETPRVADRVLQAMHVAKMAEDYVRACDRSDEMRDSDPFIETTKGLARAKACDAAHSALREAVR